MATLRPLGIGSTVLSHGNEMAGFYGEVNGIISADDLRAMVGVTQGTPMQTGDITWLKFSHNYKTLYIAKQPIQHSISWDYLQSLDLVFGKKIVINGNVYLLRLMQGSNINPTGTTPQSGVNNEWYNLMVNVVNNLYLYTNSDVGLNSGNGSRQVTQEVTGYIGTRVSYGYSNVTTFIDNDSNIISIGYGWRPVLELLY